MEEYCLTYFRVEYQDDFDMKDFCQKLNLDYEYVKNWGGENWLQIGKNENFNFNINVMIRKTIKDLIGKEEVDNVKVEYYSENIRNKYKMTISNQQLKKAFMSEDGLHKLVNMMMVAPLNSAQYDEFIAMKKLINTIEMASVNVSGYSALSDLEKAKHLTKLIKEQMYKFQFLSKGYNKQGVNTFCRPEDVVIFVKPEVKANIDVELLASAFHMDKAEVDGRLLLIDSFTKNNGETEVEDTETLCIIADKDLIQYYDTLNETESFRNADKLTTNIFHHRWAVAYGCGFVNALKIKAVE